MHDERNVRTVARRAGARLCCRRLTRSTVAANSRRDDDKPAGDISVDHNGPIDEHRPIPPDHNDDHNVQLDHVQLDHAHLNGPRTLGRLRPELRGPGRSFYFLRADRDRQRCR